MKPQILETLKHGRILSKKNFPQFVETFNYTTNRIENIKGDKDTDPQSGHIEIDNADPENPVIRYNPPADELNKIKVDSEISALGLSSLQNLSGIYEIYGFHNLSDVQKISTFSQLSNYDIVARKETNGKAEIKYLSLSSLSGGAGEIISGDTNFCITDAYPPKSIELCSNDSWNIKYYQLHDFFEPQKRNALSNDVVLVRAINQQDNRPELQYVHLSSISSNIVSGDANFDYKGQSIFLSSDDAGNKYYQLYGFSDFGSVANSVTVDLMETQAQKTLESNVEAVVRVNGKNGFVHYLSGMPLQFADLPTDTRFRNQEDHGTFSIDEKQDSNYRYLELYNFGDNSYTQGNLNIQLDYDQTKPITASEHDLLVRNRQTGALEYRSLEVYLPKDEAQQEYIGYVYQQLTGTQADLTSLSSTVLSADGKYWIKGEDNTENYGSSIGDSSKQQVINLDSKQLLNAGTPAVDWHWQTLNGTWKTTTIQGQTATGGELTANFNGTSQGLHAAQDLKLDSNYGVTIESGKNGIVRPVTIVATGNINIQAKNGYHILSNCDLWIANNKVLKIGNTTINETQLQKLLALIS